MHDTWIVLFNITNKILAASSKSANSIDKPVPRVINPSQGVTLECGSKSMKLVLDSTVTVGLALNDLQPLKENCFGYYTTVENGNYVYSIPLGGCGAQVTVCLSVRVVYTYQFKIRNA